MRQFTNIYLSALLAMSCSNLSAKNFIIDIAYESDFYLSSQTQLTKDLNNIKSKNDVEKILLNQDWIKSYYLKLHPFTKEVSVSIINKKPIYILNDMHYVDENSNLFKFDQTQLDLIRVNGPINNRDKILFIIESIKEIQQKNYPLIIEVINYDHVSGWQVKTQKYNIKFGKNIPKSKFKTLKDTLNYLYERRAIPSMIDLRYKDGVALDYGK
jgi:hypothetical protein